MRPTPRGRAISGRRRALRWHRRAWWRRPRRHQAGLPQRRGARLSAGTGRLDSSMLDSPPRAWRCGSRPRSAPAQPRPAGRVQSALAGECLVIEGLPAAEEVIVFLDVDRFADLDDSSPASSASESRNSTVVMNHSLPTRSPWARAWPARPAPRGDASRGRRCSARGRM